MSSPGVNRGFNIIIAFLILISALGIGLFYIATRDNTKDNKNDSSYTGHVAINELAQHLTDKEHEQIKIVKFLSKMEDTFHVSLNNLLQESDYLVVTYTDSKRYGLKIKFYFTSNEPSIETETKDGETTNWIRFNGYISYSYSYQHERTLLKSWYENPPKVGSWSSGFGYDSNDSPFNWVKIVNLKEFNWYQP
jgi:hypothetical protein